MDEEKVTRTIDELLDCMDGKSFGETEIMCILSTFVHKVIESTNHDLIRTLMKSYIRNINLKSII